MKGDPIPLHRIIARDRAIKKSLRERVADARAKGDAAREKFTRARSELQSLRNFSAPVG